MWAINKTITVGIADLKLTRLEGELITYALGSCIGICFYDPVIRLGGLLHVMLPYADGGSPGNVYKYADTGIEETLRKMKAFGGVGNRITAKIAGGARMFDLPETSALGNIGGRNREAVKSLLLRSGVRLTGEDTGSNYARTMSMEVATGRVKIKAYGREEINL